MNKRYAAPLEIHVCWPEKSEPEPKTLSIADEIHRRIGRWVPQGSVDPSARDQESGAGIPVLLGTRRATLTRQTAGDTTRILVGLFDSAAYLVRDEELEAVLDRPGNVVVVDDQFAERFRRADVVPAAEIVDFLVPRVTASLRELDRVTLFVHDPLGGTEIADAFWKRLGDRKLASFFERPKRTDGEEMRKSPASSLLVHVRRDRSTNVNRNTHVLVAKELAMPVVSALCMESGEDRESAYAGNAPAVVVNAAQAATIDRLIDECARAWLGHAYFMADAERLRASAGLPLDTVLLSRPPELVDFASGALPSSAAVVLYRDPPLSLEESTLIRRQYPRARLVTPTTVHGQILGRTARPPLDGMRVALSLSDSPAIPELSADAAPVWEGERHEQGLTERHYREVVEHLSLCLIRGGAELAYGGHLEQAHTVALSRLVAAHQRFQRSPDELLHVYGTSQTPSGTAARKVLAKFHSLQGGVPAASGDAKKALDLTAMRRTMSSECHARIILGGKTMPAARKDGVAIDKKGYSGRFPGQAEEAWFTLRGAETPRPLYVVGAFGGAAADVGHALRGAAIPPHEEVTDGFAAFRELVDSRRAHGPRSLEEMWSDFRGSGEELRTEDGSRMCRNGLTVEENHVLFESRQPAEIAALVMRGLMRVSRRDVQSAPLALMPSNGSITDSPPVHVYVVPVVEGLPMGGADRALDLAMDGALAAARLAVGEDRFAKAGHIEVVPVRSGRLAGDWVAMISLGRHADVGRQANAFDLGRAVGQKAAQQGWGEIATVPMGGNLSARADIAERTGDFIRGVCSVDGQPIRSIVMCEWDAAKYESLKSACLDLAKESPHVTARILPANPVPPRQASVSTVLTVSRLADDLHCQLIPPRGSTLAPLYKGEIRSWVDRHLKGAELVLDDGGLTGMRDTLRRTVLSEHASRELENWVRHPVRVQHDEKSAPIPFELLLSFPRDGGDDYVFALEEGVSRALQTSSPVAAKPPRPPSRGRMRVLMVVDPTSNLPLAREEAARLETDLKLRGADVLPPLVGDSATREAVLAALGAQPVDVLHYSGHAAPEGLHLKGQPLEAADFAKLGPDAVPSLVVLNACQSAVVGPAPTGDETLASSILHSGARCFVGTGWRVPDEVAARFGRRFLREVADGIPVGLALARTLKEMRYADFSKMHWFYYRLFGDADFVHR